MTLTQQISPHQSLLFIGINLCAIRGFYQENSGFSFLADDALRPQLGSQYAYGDGVINVRERGRERWI